MVGRLSSIKRQRRRTNETNENKYTRLQQYVYYSNNKLEMDGKHEPLKLKVSGKSR